MYNELGDVRQFIRDQRKKADLTQPQLARKAGVGVRFIRDLEQGKQQTFQTDTINKVLRLFGKHLGPIDLPADAD